MTGACQGGKIKKRSPGQGVYGIFTVPGVRNDFA